MACVCHSLAECQRHTSSSLAAVIGLSNNDVISLRSLRCVSCVGWKPHFNFTHRAAFFLPPPPLMIFSVRIGTFMQTTLAIQNRRCPNNGWRTCRIGVTPSWHIYAPKLTQRRIF